MALSRNFDRRTQRLGKLDQFLVRHVHPENFEIIPECFKILLQVTGRDIFWENPKKLPDYALPSVTERLVREPELHSVS
jgi:hypothetical protein